MKSHFKFSKGQRNGIFVLLILAIVFQCIYFYVNFSYKEYPINNEDFELFQKEIDSLRIVEVENRKPKIYPFNPNFITDYRGYTLGMSNEEIDRLLDYRKQNQWVNSVQQFQKVTQVSDSLLKEISPYFKFPDWVTNPKPQNSNSFNNYNNPKSFEEKIDLNIATASQLQRVNGIGKALSERIVKFRNKFVGGFIADVQLQDVYGLSPEVIERIKEHFTVKTPRQIERINLNTATTEQLVTIQHIDYQLAYSIIEQRTLREGYKSLDELLKVKDFPLNKIEIIKLYLTLD
ncbi:MAG TPA: helix-hairpin-helix domain-containing protein [Flavobacteriaceae bacterium]|nr:helix-hairpin-helix domain-containing protein [Flavobacteriaceae bacterium]